MWIRLLYSCVLALASPFFLYSLYKKKPGKPMFGPRWQEHWGRTPKVDAENPIWIHAVSVGESIAAIPIINALKERDPDTQIVVTTTTSTGAEQIDKLGDKVIHRYMPLDFTWCVKGFLKAVKPSQMLIIETELWPNTLHQVAKHGIPITVINARLSERSCLRYQKFQRVFDSLAQHVSLFLCQYASDAERFIRLGVAAERIDVTGSVKFDVRIGDDVATKGSALRSQLGEKRPIWIAASTHQGEEDVILAAHKALLTYDPNALLIVVPRHPERFNDVATLCQQQGFSVIRRTSQQSDATSQVYLADTMGEMLVLISAADVCFMGGSLVGEKVGGHNLLEPAALSKAILSGPSYFNFHNIANELISNNGLVICHNSNQIAECLIRLLEPNNHEQQVMGEQALKVVERNRGAVIKTLNHIFAIGK